MPLLFDMPLEQCREYKGTNPKPKDFDEYWDSSIAEMKSIDTKIEFIPTKYNFGKAQAFDIWYTGVGGARIHGKCVKPLNEDKPVPTVLLFHGYSGAGDDFPGLLNWASMGFAAFSIDARGQAGFSEDLGGVKGNTLNGHIIRGLDDEDPKKLLFRSIFLDCAQLAHLAMDLDFVDEKNVFCAGGSQGGGLSTACASLEPRIKKASITYPFLTDYKRIWQIDLYKDAYTELNWYFRNRDPHHLREEEIWTKLGYIDVHFLAERIEAEVIMNTGLCDTVCPPSTQFAVYNNIKSKKHHNFWYDYGHEWLPGEWNTTASFFNEGLN